MLTSRERILTTLDHKEPDRVAIDLGGMLSTGIMGIAYNRLKSYLKITGGRTKMYDFRQQLAEPEIVVLERIGGDVVPVLISEPGEWKQGKLPDGSACEVPEDFDPEMLADGSQVLRQGDRTTLPPRARVCQKQRHASIVGTDPVFHRRRREGSSRYSLQDRQGFRGATGDRRDHRVL